jgi:hypothetical protein
MHVYAQYQVCLCIFLSVQMCNGCLFFFRMYIGGGWWWWYLSLIFYCLLLQKQYLWIWCCCTKFWQIDRIRGLVRFLFLDISFLTKNKYTSISSSVWNTHLSFLSSVHISFFLSYRRKMYLFIVLLSSTCIVYIFSYFFLRFLFFLHEEQWCYSLVVIVYISPLHFVFFLFIIILILLWKDL